jgi:hypothetical protein
MGTRIATTLAGVAGLAAAVLVVVGLMTSLLRGGPPLGPGGGAGARVPYVVDEAGLFSESVVSETDGRLESIFRATGFEVTLRTRTLRPGEGGSLPEGWPYTFDRNGSDDGDLMLAVDVGSDGLARCCLTVMGPAVRRVVLEAGNDPLDMLAAFESATRDERDAALLSFADGVESLGPRVAGATWEIERERFVPVAAFGAGLFALSGMAVAELAARRGWWRPSARAGRLTWAVGGAGALILWAFVVGLVTLPSAALGQSFQPSIDGPGIVEEPAGLGWPVLISAAVLTGIASARAAGRRRRLVFGALAVALLAWGAAGRLQPEPVQGYMWGPHEGVREASAPPGTDAAPVYYVVAEPGGLVRIVTTFANLGPLPMTIQGIVEPGRDWYPDLHWTAVGYDLDPLRIGFTEDARSFSAVRLEPGETAEIYLVGRAGRCAVGPSFREDTGEAFGYASTSTVRVSFSVLGLERTVDMALPLEIVQPTVDPCGHP